jgi:hypothetical protein
MSSAQKNRWHQNRLDRGEVVGGGYIVLRRGRAFGRISIDKGKLPFEHATLESAVQECERLAQQHPGCEFNVWHTAVKMKSIAQETTS